MTQLIFILALMFASDYNQLPVKMSNGISVASALDGCPNCACGIIRQDQSRIKGGNEVQNIYKYPWMAQLHIGGNFCGGSLINSIYVITAAHCVYQYAPEHITNVIGGAVVLLDQNRRAPNEPNAIVRRVADFLVHPYFNRQTLDYDIALIKMDQHVPMGRGPGRALPICLTHGDFSDFSVAIAIGWGRTIPDGNLSPVLNEIILLLWTLEVCQRVYPLASDVKICAGDPRKFGGPLQGDSGGPLMIVQDSRLYLIGIVSGVEQRYGTTMFTKVSRFIDWIQNNTADACTCTN